MLDDASEKTIGDYFRSNLLLVRGAVEPDDFARFARLSTNSERVNFVLGYPEAHLLPLRVANDARRGKDSGRALEARRLGNERYVAGDRARALEFYSSAVLVAPRNELAVPLANRSAVLHAIGRYDLALADIGEALAVGYPPELAYKLEERRARCWLALENHPRAVEAFGRTLVALDRADLAAERRAKIETDVGLMLALMERTTSARNPDDRRSEATTRSASATIPRLDRENPLYPALARSVEIRDGGPVRGRHAVAARKVRPGELLAVEAPRVAVLLEEYRRTHCQECFSRALAPYPAACDACDSVVYCSAACRDARPRVHATECEILPTLWRSRASVTCLMALRAITQRPFETVRASRRDVESDDYAAFHALVTHESEREPEDLFHRAFMAGWLLRLLRTTDYLPNGAKTPDLGRRDLSEDESLLGGLLLRYLQILAFNTHEISEFARPTAGGGGGGGGGGGLESARSVFIGGGVYPTVALFNHSCNPGVVRCFVGTTVILRAVRTIPAGTEISENYGPVFTTRPEDERRRELRTRYWFDCACEACTGHWPLLDRIDPRILRFKCETGASCGNVLPIATDSDRFVIGCPKCGRSTNVLKGLKALRDTDELTRKASRCLETGRWDLALRNYVKALSLIDETLALPVRDYHVCQEGLRLCVLALGGALSP